MARREHSKKELQRKLVQKGFEASEVDQAIDELADEGLQSELRYIEALVHSKAERGFGPLKIKALLRERGIDDPSILAYFVTLPENFWHEVLLGVWCKKFAGRVSDTASKAKAIRYLQYKGFDLGSINRLMRDDE